MRFECCENNLKLVFEVSEEGKLSLMHFSKKEYKDYETESNKCWYTPFEIHTAGGNQDDHHGATHKASSGSKSLKYKEHKLYDNNDGKKLEIELCDDSLKAVLHYQFYNGISGVRAWCEISNISNENVGLEYVTSFAYLGIDKLGDKPADEKMKVYIPYNSWCRELDWKEYSLSDLGVGGFTATNRINISNTGTWSAKEYVPMGAVLNTEAGEALMWQIENNGSWQWEIASNARTLYLKLSGPTENENHWYKELKPGESFKTVKAAVMAGEDFDSVLEQMTKYRRKIVRHNEADSFLPVIFNDYMNCLGADPTTEKEIPIIDVVAKTGAEYYCMDAGWYADGTWWETVGEWQPCEWRFKNGIKEVFDYIRSKGMIPGIWIEIEVMGINCPILNQFTDDCFFMRHGKRVIDHGRYQLDFRNEKVRKFATEVIERLINDFGVGYFKMDYNIDAGAGTEVNSDSFGDGLLEHNRAYLAWIEGIMNKYPDLVIESCASGSMRMDYGMLSIHSIYSVSDNAKYTSMARIARNAATALLPEQAAIWTYPISKDDDNATAVNMINAMLLRMHLSGEIANLTDSQFKLIKEGIRCYKEIRKDIKSFIPFYPDGVEVYSKKWFAVGYKGENSTYLAVWRLDSDADKYFVDFKNNYKTCEIIYPGNNNATTHISENGIDVILPEQNSAVIIKLS